MKHKFFALFTVGLLILNLVGAVSADTKSKKIKKQTNALVALLPASDGVVTVDIKRLLNNALPQILSGNPSMLAEMNGAVEEIKQSTGIDLRQFDQVAAGFVVNSTNQDDYQPIVIARGQYNAGSLISIVKLASNGSYREEKIGNRTIYIFSAKAAAEKNKPKTKNSTISGMIDKLIAGLNREMAVTGIDAKTLAFGTTERVRQTLTTKPAVSAEVSEMINRNPGAMMSFAGKVPNGMGALLPLDNDELGKTIDSIRYLYGTMNVAGENTTFRLMAKTTAPAEAQELLETLEALQMVGKAFLGNAKGADKQVYARMIENAKFTRTANELTLDLSVPQNDINVLIGSI